MDQRIFDLGLGVEATSLYILLDSLNQGGVELTPSAAEPLWNGPAQELARAAQELIEAEVLIGPSQGPWFIQPGADWRWPE